MKSLFGEDARLNRESTRSMRALTKRRAALEESEEQTVHSKRWGIVERAALGEDYSPYGTGWYLLPAHHARSRPTAAKTALPDSVIGIRLEDFIAEVIL